MTSPPPLPNLAPRIPFTDYEVVTVVFGAADTDFRIQTTLKPEDPGSVDYLVLRADRATSIYHSPLTVWPSWSLFLRSSAANAVVDLLLTLRP